MPTSKDDIQEIKIHLAEISKDLKYHIKRTDLLEEHLKQLETRLVPITSHINSVKSITKFLLAMVTIGAAIAGIITLFIN